MKGSISILFLLMLFSSCSNSSEELEKLQPIEIFTEVHLSEEDGLYFDRKGKKMNGTLLARYKNGSVHASLTFSDGMIRDGVIRLEDGTLYSDYLMSDGKNYYTRYWPDEKPRTMVVHEGNYNNRTEFHVWYENGIPLISSNSNFTRTWFEDGQIRMEVLRKGDDERGVARSWHMSGELKAEANFESEPYAGVYREWNKNGELIKKRTSAAGSSDE